MPNFRRQLLLTYSAIFGHEFTEETTAIKSIDKIKWAKIIAKINHLTRTRSNINPRELFSIWFAKENTDIANQIWDKLILSYAKMNIQISDLLVLNIWSSLTLYDRVLSSKKTDETITSDSKAEVLALKMYLAINEVAADRTDSITRLVTAKDYPNIIDRFARVTITLLYPYHDLKHFQPLELLIAQFIKSYYCLQFLKSNYPELLLKFLKPYGVSDSKDYLKGILPIAHMAAMPGDPSGLNYLNISNSPNKEQSRIFLEHLTLVTEEEYKLIKILFMHDPTRYLKSTRITIL